MLLKECKICNLENPEKNHFYSQHKISLEKYILSYYPKKDLFDNSPIAFTGDLESYFNKDFNNKNNLKSYLKNFDDAGVIHYLKGLLSRRKEIKKLVYAPGSFELRSLMICPLTWLIKRFPNNKDLYNEICKEVGLKVRYNYNEVLEFDNDKELKFIIDTREAKIIDLPNKTIKKMEYADYSIENNDKRIFIERKSLVDALSSFTSGFDRFCREIERVIKDDSYLIILIEEKFQNLMSFPYLPHCRNTKITVDYLHHKIREIGYKYPLSAQFLAVDGRKESIRVIEKIFRLKNDVKKLDVQYLYDIKGL